MREASTTNIDCCWTEVKESLADHEGVSVCSVDACGVGGAR